MSNFPVFRWVTVSALATLWVILLPSAASAHAAIVSSTPAAGEKLKSAPGVVSLTFSEPLITDLSRMVVIDPSGRRQDGRPSGERKMEARLTTNAPGVYRVEWKTVSPVDGHSLRGRFSFGVGVQPTEDAETALAPGFSELTVALFRALEYAGILAAAGAILITTLGRRKPKLEGVRPNLRIPLAIALVSGIAVVVGEALLASSNLSDAGAFFGTLPGLARLMRLGFEAAALTFAPSTTGAAINVALAMTALSSAGHAAAIRPAPWGIGIDAVHLASAGVWAGGIITLAIIAARSRGDWRKLLDRFTPIAIPAFLVTVTSGLLRGTQEMGHLSDLWDSGYGRVLSVKSAGVLAMIPLSILAWRRVLKGPRVEAALAGLVIVAAALLAAFPLPPARVAEAESAAPKPSVSGLPEPEDLTFGAYAGEVLIGITLRPGEPGMNQILVYLLPIEGEEEASDASISAIVDGRKTNLEKCGTTCRSGRANLRGGEVIALSLGGDKGGRTEVLVPSLPAPDASELLAKMDTRMRALKTLRIEETLRPSETPTSALYSLQAPDRLRMQVSSGFENVRIGDVSYQRESPSAEWKVERGVPAIEAPFFIWGQPPYASAHILGSESQEGADLTIVGFFEDRGGLPIWFKQWIDPDGLVRKSEMRAQGHFMDHAYFDFDAPFTIDPPVKG